MAFETVSSIVWFIPNESVTSIVLMKMRLIPNGSVSYIVS